MTSKITRLSPTDLANDAALPTALKRPHLERIENPDVFWNLDPVRSHFPKIVLAEPSLPLLLEAGKDEALIQLVSSACKRGEDQRTACVAIATALISWRTKNNVRGVFPPVAILPYRSTVDVVYFAENLVLVIDGVLYIVALDLRANESLTLSGREVVKSLLWHTARIGSLKSAKIALLRTPSVGKGQRKVIFEVLEGEPKFSLDELDRMILESYSIWQLILMARRAASSDGKGMSGGLFDL